MYFRDISIINHLGETAEHMHLVTTGRDISWLAAETPPAELIESGEEIFDGKDHVLMPGMYNLHCHVPMTLMRGYGERLPLMLWLTERIFPFEALQDAEDIYWGALLGIYEMLSSGVCSFSDMYMRLEGVFQAVDEAGIKANLTNALVGGDDTVFKTNNSYLELRWLLEAIKSTDGRVKADAGLHGEYTSNERLAREVADWAKEENLLVQVHVSETKKEHEECKLRHGGRTPAEYLEYVGLLDQPTVAAHGVWLEESDMDIYARKGVTLAHCPSSNLKLGSGIANLKKIKEHGIKINIATDGASSNNNLNLLEEVTLGILLARGSSQDPTFLSTPDIMEMMTSNGAAAQGRADSGTLAVGKRADLIVFNLNKAHLQPIYDIAANIFHSAQQSDLVLNMIDGRVVYRDGVAAGIDLERVLWEVNRIRNEKLKRLAEK